MDNCVFCKIVSGDIPSFKVLEDENHLAFLSVAPIAKGHTLIIPKSHSEYVFDMEDNSLGDMMKFSKKVAPLLSNSLKPKTGKIGIMVAGLEVSHTHIHLIPMDKEGDLSFINAKPASEDELEETLGKILSSQT